MFDVADAGERSEEELRAAYADELRAAVETLGVAAAAERTDIERAVLASLVDGGEPDLSLALEDAAALVAAAEDDDPEALAAEARDRLLLGMTTAVLDVEAVESGIDGRMEAKEIQQKVEGRFPMTVAEYAVLHRFIAGGR
jgi:hypothetical protein